MGLNLAQVQERARRRTKRIQAVHARIAAAGSVGNPYLGKHERIEEGGAMVKAWHTMKYLGYEAETPEHYARVCKDAVTFLEQGDTAFAVNILRQVNRVFEGRTVLSKS